MDFTSQFGAALVGAARRRPALFLSTEEEEEEEEEEGAAMTGSTGLGGGGPAGPVAAGTPLPPPPPPPAPRLRHSKSIDEALFAADAFPARGYRGAPKGGGGAGSAFSSVAAASGPPPRPKAMAAALQAGIAALQAGLGPLPAAVGLRPNAAGLRPSVVGLRPHLAPDMAPLATDMASLATDMAPLAPDMASLTTNMAPLATDMASLATDLAPLATPLATPSLASLATPKMAPPVALPPFAAPMAPLRSAPAPLPLPKPPAGLPPRRPSRPPSPADAWGGSGPPAANEARVRFAEAGGLLALPPPAPSVDGDEELLLAEPLPPPLEFANSFEAADVAVGPSAAAVGDSTASSLTSYDSEVATITQAGPEGRRGPLGPHPDGLDAVTDSGIEEVDSRSSSDHPPEHMEPAAAPPYGLPPDGTERARARGRGGPRGADARRGLEPWEEPGRGLAAAAWSRGAADGSYGGTAGRHRLPDPPPPPQPSKPPPSSSISPSSILFPNWPPGPKSPLGGVGVGGLDLDIRPPLRRAPSPATLPSERRGSPAPRPASLPTLPAAPLYAGFLELRGGPFGDGGGSSRSLSPTRPPPPPPDKPFGAKPLAFWSKFDVADWLEYLNLGEHRARFLHNEIDGSHLPALTKEDYIDLGVTRVGHRMNIDRALKVFLER